MGSVGSKQNNNLYANIKYIEGTPSNQQNADEVVKGVRDVLDDFGFGDELKAIYFNDKGTITKGEANASMNGAGDLTISNNYIGNPTKESDGYFVSDTYYGTGAHEAGHAVINALLKNYVAINPDDTNKSSSRANLERATARRLGKLEHEILKEAKKRYGSNPPISKYGSTKEVEKIAEAVSDVYANKNNANSYSKLIVQVMKDIKNNKFKPVIKVSKKQMGI